MNQITIPLGNGYNLVAVDNADPECPHEIHVGVTDSDDIWNQDIVRVIARDNGERFNIQAYLDNNAEDPSNTFSVDLYKFQDIDDENDNADEDHYEDSEDDIEPDSEIEDQTQEPANYNIKVLARGVSDNDSVKKLQQRLIDLGYLNDVSDGVFGKKTEAAVKAFQSQAGLDPDGIASIEMQEILFSDNADLVHPQSQSYTKVHGKAIDMDWWTSDIQKIFAKGVTALITDVETGLSWQEQRRGGKNHADVQPLTKEDTANLKKAYGGKWAWTRRAIWVTINGVHYAASMNGMPHGGSSISGNGFDGHHCIHFTNSRTHASDRVDENHQKAIQKALKATL